MISGTPSMATNASFTVQAMGNNGLSAAKAFDLTINPAPLQFAVTSGSLSVSNGVFNMRLTGPAGSNVVVDVSSDLSAWMPWQTNTLPVEGLDLAMPMGANEQQFFRARMP